MEPQIFEATFLDFYQYYKYLKKNKSISRFITGNKANQYLYIWRIPILPGT
jgi:hypothetical protein